MIHLMGSILIFLILAITLLLIHFDRQKQKINPEFIKWLIALAVVLALIFY